MFTLNKKIIILINFFYKKIILSMFSETTRKRLEEIHRIQIVGIDLDIIFTLTISYYISLTYHYDFYKVLFIIVLVSIIVHRILRINTRVNEMIFGKV